MAVRDKVRSGALLSEAFESTGSFPKIYCATVRAGERSGSLDKVLGQYLTYQKQSRGFRKKFISALIYPAFLLVVLSILVTLVIEFIVPQFAKLYADMDVQLPAMTTFTISFAMQIKHYLLLIILAGVGVGLLVKSAARSEQSPAGLGAAEVPVAPGGRPPAEVFRGGVCAHPGGALTRRHSHCRGAGDRQGIGQQSVAVPRRLPRRGRKWRRERNLAPACA